MKKENDPDALPQNICYKLIANHKLVIVKKKNLLVFPVISALLRGWHLCGVFRTSMRRC